jgi:Diguanylate cyclase, GGDEF domain
MVARLTGNISFARDHIEKTERLNYLAYYDALTGLANRTFFHERLSQYVSEASRNGRKFALVIVDPSGSRRSTKPLDATPATNCCARLRNASFFVSGIRTGLRGRPLSRK